MYFANFKELRIDKDFHYTTIHLDIEVSPQTSVIALYNKVRDVIANAELVTTDTPVLYHFNVTGIMTEDENAGVQELLDDMLSLTNMIVPTTLKALETGFGYKRERRLDAPDSLKPLHTTYSVIKRACNIRMITPVLNIQVSYHNVSYLMCDTKEIDKYDDEGDSSDE